MFVLTMGLHACLISPWRSMCLQLRACTVLYTTGAPLLSCLFPENSWALVSTFYSGKESKREAQEWSFSDVEFLGKKKKEKSTYNLRMNSAPSTSSVEAAVSPGDTQPLKMEFLSGARTHKDTHKNRSNTGV